MKRTCSPTPLPDECADDAADDLSPDSSDDDDDIAAADIDITSSTGAATQRLTLVDGQALWRAGPAAIDAFVHAHFRTQPPRPHQQRAVTRLVTDVLARAARAAPRRNYLVQHATGSGKSLTLSCLACVLARLAWPSSTSTPSSPSSELVPLYARVVVVNDRRHLDSQLRRTLAALLAANGGGGDCGVVARAARLADVFAAHRIVVTTLQKFGARLQHGGAAAGPPLVGDAPVALVTDEAHRSYGAAHTRSLHEVLTGHTAQPAGVSYFAFTSTPSVRAMTMFGAPDCGGDGIDDVVGDDKQDGGSNDKDNKDNKDDEETTGKKKSKKGKFIEPFDTYTFDDAIADGYIIDFSRNYASLPVKELLQQQQEQQEQQQEGQPSADNSGGAVDAATPTPEAAQTTTEEALEERVFKDGRAAAQRLAREAAMHVPLLRAKAAFVLAHLRDMIAALDDAAAAPPFRMCAMLAVPTRRHVVWYTTHLRRLVAALPAAERFGVVAAFSPFVLDGVPLSEASAAVNGVHARLCTPQDGIVAALHAPHTDIRLIVVADKLQTGFDEPRLAGLYVDKPVAGAAVVQTLGRLARVAPGKRDVYVVDFVNARDAVARAIAQYWDPVRMRRPPAPDALAAQLERTAARLVALVPVLAQQPSQEQSQPPQEQSEDIRAAAERIVAALFDHHESKSGGLTHEEATFVCKSVRAFVTLCNALQTNVCDGVALARVLALAGAVAAERRRCAAADLSALGAVAGDLAVLVEVGELERAAALARGPARPLRPARVRERPGPAPTDTRAMTAPEVVALANDLMCPHSTGTSSGIPEDAAPATYTADELDFARGLWQWSRREQRAAVQTARRESASKLAVRALLDTAERMLRDANGSAPDAEAAPEPEPAPEPPLSMAGALVRLVRGGECAAPLFVETVLALVEPDGSGGGGGGAAQTLRELVQADGAAVVAGIVEAAAHAQPPEPAHLRAAARLWCRVWQCVRADPDTVPTTASADASTCATTVVRALLGVLAPVPDTTTAAAEAEGAQPVQCAALRAVAFTLRGCASADLAWAREPLADRALACLATAPPGPLAACAVQQLARCADALSMPARVGRTLAGLAAALTREHDAQTVHGVLALLRDVLERTDRRTRPQHRGPLQALVAALPALRAHHAAEPRVQALLRALAAAVAEDSGTAHPPGPGAGVPRFQPKFPQPKRKRGPPSAPCETGDVHGQEQVGPA